MKAETGRYVRPKIPREERICKNCKQNTVESEEHALTECDLYEELREELFNYITSYCQNCSALSNKNKAIFLLTIEDTNCMQRVAKFCHDALELRKNKQQN